MCLVLVSPDASFAIDSSMFVVNGSWESGYEYDKDIFFMLGFKLNKDYVYIGDYSSNMEYEVATQIASQNTLFVVVKEGINKYALVNRLTNETMYFIHNNHIHTAFGGGLGRGLNSEDILDFFGKTIESIVDQFLWMHHECKWCLKWKDNRAYMKRALYRSSLVGLDRNPF